MSRTPKTTSTAVANWEQELEQQAQVAAGMAASTGDAQFFSVRAGQLSFGGMPLPGNQMGVVILDAILENVYYEGEFNPDEPAPPTCFAFARDAALLTPHEVVVEAGQAQHAQCKGCPHNEWGSADRGRGKACRNVRRLALIPAGTIDVASGRFEPYTDPSQFERGAVGYLKVPVTSCKGFDTFVKQVAGALRRPPHGIFTRVVVRPDPKTQVAVTFEPLAPLPNNVISIAMRRHAELAEEIAQPYPLTYDRDEVPPAPVRGRATTPAGRSGQARRAKY